MQKVKSKRILMKDVFVWFIVISYIAFVFYISIFIDFLIDVNNIVCLILFTISILLAIVILIDVLSRKPKTRTIYKERKKLSYKLKLLYGYLTKIAMILIFTPVFFHFIIGRPILYILHLSTAKNANLLTKVEKYVHNLGRYSHEGIVVKEYDYFSNLSIHRAKGVRKVPKNTPIILHGKKSQFGFSVDLVGYR